ncbi:twin-arginine translocation pathway signal [Nocardia asteroides]|uniref:twin-arginine translocation pathway signal n=1 Tax=Nocardia asteroides TaxID=1824 RepID=UPI001E5C6CE7|nr:twin-arginine translocation pathway signal [Nocardia asteroides]UGT61299.1 twin-arginine translocation pathway signal [Nocardia asteroides]
MTARLRANAGSILLAILVIASIATAATLYAANRPDEGTGTAAQERAVAAATEGTVALLSYAPDTLDRDFAAAEQHLTGDFLDYYSQFTEQVVAPAAREKSVRTSATVVRAAVAELRQDQAVVLVFINQSTTSAEKPDPALAASSVRVTLDKVSDTWRIAAFDPV